MQIALRNTVPGPRLYDLAVALVDARGQPVADWQGWPVPNYPSDQWSEGAIVRIPVTVELPVRAEDGPHTLVAALVEQPGDVRGPDVELGAVELYARPASFDPPPMSSPLPEPVQFGTHARLVGYDAAGGTDGDGDFISLQLHWEVLQPLRPQHHIFVHAVDAHGDTLAQQDGAPMTSKGPAPTGSWLPNEYITTQHTITMPAESNDSNGSALQLSVGLYDPRSGVRLPAFANDAPSGDSAILHVVQ